MSDKTIQSLSQESQVITPPCRETAAIQSMEEYEAIYKRSIENMDEFWAQRATELLSWEAPFDTVCDCDFDAPDIKWFDGGKLNVAYNCLDRHLENGRRNKAAIIFQGEQDEDVKVYTYQMLHDEVCKFANVLKKKGVKKGDRVSIYLPMVPELAIAMLACARIGAPHSIIFAGFSANALRDRINDCGSKVHITGTAVNRAGRQIPLKGNTDDALKECPDVEQVVVVDSAKGFDNYEMVEGRDIWWHEEISAHDISAECPYEVMDSEDPLFILYTSGSTGKPKGVFHSQAGYLTYAAHTCQWVFDLKDNDVHWCTADIGWVTGHSYIVYGPLALGATSLMFEGVPTYPKPDRFWQVVEKFKVNIFYTAPTVIRALMREGEQWTTQHDLSSLRILGSVGEPINPEAWNWYHKYIGKSQLPIVDTWWQTETGGHVLSGLPYATPMKPGAASRPLPGIDAAIVNKEGQPVAADEGGFLVIRKPWPGMLRGVWGDTERFKTTYFAGFPGCYESGDGARCDADGYFWIMGRVDDVINVSGHRLGTAEIESTLVAHEAVSEAAVVGMPHEIKGQTIYAYVTLKNGVDESEELKKELVMHVRKDIGPLAAPELLQFAPGLPKTRSGKIMRRILRKIVEGDTSNLGDTSTLADPSVVEDLIEGNADLLS